MYLGRRGINTIHKFARIGRKPPPVFGHVVMHLSLDECEGLVCHQARLSRQPQTHCTPDQFAGNFSIGRALSWPSNALHLAENPREFRLCYLARGKTSREFWCDLQGIGHGNIAIVAGKPFLTGGEARIAMVNGD
jgi:hypothetical protein